MNIKKQIKEYLNKFFIFTLAEVIVIAVIVQNLDELL